MLRALTRIAPAATLTLGFLSLVLALLLFDQSAKTPDGLAAIRLGFLTHRDAILIVCGVFSLAVLFGGIWVASLIRNVSRIVREGREEAEAVNQERARVLQKEMRTSYRRKKKSRR
jgi:formate-dependent nitrite reductase membrane component NrfD